MPKNLFIVIDGMDGSGKGEMVAKLHNYLFSKSKNYRILTTREPTSGEYGKKIRQLLKDDSDPITNAELCLDLYIKDRDQHLNETILPFLHKQDGNTNIIICDRYYYSTIAFQHTQGINLNKILELNKEFRKPDLAFILDLSPKRALQRISQAREVQEKFEKLDFMQKLRENFLKLKDLLKEENIKIIDASKEIEDVFNQIKLEIDTIL